MRGGQHGKLIYILYNFCVTHRSFYHGIYSCHHKNYCHHIASCYHIYSFLWTLSAILRIPIQTSSSVNTWTPDHRIHSCPSTYPRPYHSTTTIPILILLTSLPILDLKRLRIVCHSMAMLVMEDNLLDYFIDI
jgi:hypothetical protein